jgi:preprotein translocase subunit YajC
MGGAEILVLLLPVAALWFLIIRPAQRRQREAVQLRDSLAPGQEIITTAGVIGTLVQVDDDEVTLSVAPGVELRMVKAAVGQVRSAPPERDDPASEHDDAARPD